MHKILLIDSDSASAEKTASALTKSGFEVMVALSEPEGLKIADEASPDAVIVRDSPPQLDGFKLCGGLRRAFNLPLILLGDKLEDEVYTPDMKIPSDWGYYIPLPINYEGMAARLKVLLWRCGKGEKP